MQGLEHEKHEQLIGFAEPLPATESRGRAIGFVVALMSMLLNQSSVIFNVNMSLADIFCILTFLMLIYTTKWLTLFMPTVFFMSVTLTAVFTSLFYVPFKYFLAVDITGFAVSYIKLIVVFIYFLLGYNLSMYGHNNRVLKWFSAVAAATAIVGLPAAIFDFGPVSQALMYGGVRLIGLMNDPNYYSIIQASAFVYFSRKPGLGNHKRALLLLMLAASIFASGSKTGILTLLIYTLFRAIMAFFRRKVNVGLMAAVVMACNLAIIVSVFAKGLIYTGIKLMSEHIPAFHRIAMLFTDFSGAVSGMGSGRDLAWKVALALIRESPVIGIGLGTYSDLAYQYYGTTVIAHNTYLQLMCEWGIVLTLLLFGYIFINIGRATLSDRAISTETLALRDMLIIFLIGSLAISLNNARLFWLFLGMFVESSSKEKKPAGHDLQRYVYL
ncbi:MAG TPA: O-antigen ligase family protein [Candidatus Atribacteria bacterium]|nr:O-antigen ligase family protein [Candidatus Atribacteria bacterium]